MKAMIQSNGIRTKAAQQLIQARLSGMAVVSVKQEDGASEAKQHHRPKKPVEGLRIRFIRIPLGEHGQRKDANGSPKHPDCYARKFSEHDALFC
jgi:hypothetical protein